LTFGDQAQVQMQQITGCNRMDESQHEGAFLAIPRYEEFMLPMLRLLADGQIQHVSALREQLAQQFDLSESDRQMLQPSGKTRLFDNRVAWARTDLGMAGALEGCSRGRVRITERGRAILAQNPEGIDRKLLRRYPEFESFMLRKRSKPERQDGTTEEPSPAEHESASPGQTEPAETAALSNQQDEAEPAAPLTETLSFTDAAASVLERFAGKKPMHYRTITQKILELGLVRVLDGNCSPT
jgi:restriction endonuclease Mrr